MLEVLQRGVGRGLLKPLQQTPLLGLQAVLLFGQAVDGELALLLQLILQ